MTQPTPTPGFAPAPVNSTQWNSQVVEAQAQARIQDTQTRADMGMNWVPDWIQKPVEWVGSKIHAVYSAAISRPISTLFMATYLDAAEANSTSDEWGKLFSGDLWDRAYQDAKHVSPGQALTFGLMHFGEGREEFKKSMAQDITGKVEVQPGIFQEQHLNKTGIIWDNPQAVQSYFDSGAQKWVSGGLDAYSSWFLDPLALAGKAAGSLRQVAYVRRAITGQTNKAGEVINQSLAQKVVGVGGVQNNVTKNIQSSAFGQMSDLIMKNKQKLGDGFSDWATRQAWAKNSADGGAMAAALHQAKNQDEVNNVLAVAMGDKTALDALTAKNQVLGRQLEMLEQQKQGLISNFPANPTALQAGQQQMQLDAVAKAIEGISTQNKFISDAMNVENYMTNGMYFMPGVSKIASNFGQYARGLETTATGKMLRVGGARAAGMSLLYNNLYVRPVRLISGTTWNGVRAPGHINIDAADSYRALDASLEQAKLWSAEQRAEYVSKYINADPAGRNAILETADNQTFLGIANRYGLNENQAQALYRQIGGMKGAARDGRVYSTAEIKTADGGSLRADHVDDAGNVIAVKPVFNTQLENTHIMTDYEHLDRVLRMTSGAFKKLLNEGEIQARAATMGPLTKPQTEAVARQAVEKAGTKAGAKAYRALQVGSDLGEVMNKVWKFTTLLRLGYGPRAIADDFMGQAARFGAANMFIDRFIGGATGQGVRGWNRAFSDTTGYEQQLAGLDLGISRLQQSVDRSQGIITDLTSKLPVGTAASHPAIISHTASMKSENNALNLLKERRNKLVGMRAKLGDRYVITPDGTAFPRPFEGPEGQLFKDLNSGRRSVDSMLGGTSVDIWNAYRTGAWNTITRDSADYDNAWLRIAQRQIGQDEAARVHLSGQDLEQWFGTKAGKEYRKVSGIRNLDPAEHADRIASSVDHYLPSSTPETMAVRQAVLDGADDKDVLELMKQVPTQHAPTTIQEEGLKYAMGKGQVFSSIDKMMDGFYNRMNKLPAEVLSRNPLFHQLYRQHVSEQWQIAKDSGRTTLSPAQQQKIATASRKLALNDVKKFTFNMDFESKLAYKMRFIAPFWGPTQESFTRWARIAADRPETISHAANIYTSPTKLGMTVDKNGNPVDQDGYSVDEHGKRYLVPKDEMHIQFQAPQWFAKAIGMEQGSTIDMPINTMNLVLQNDPWFNPGTGPWVQVPADWAALRTDPEVGDVMQKLGVLNKVTPNVRDQILGSTPKFLAALVGGQDREQQQKDMIYLMQSEHYKFVQGLRDKEPTLQEIKDRASHAAYLRGFMKTVLPFSADVKDPYQFFRDRYHELQTADPKTADQVFLAEYGDAAFAFTGALTSSKTNAPSTIEGVRKAKQYDYLIEQDPDLAGLILGPYKSGDFSQTAYIQQMASGDRTINTVKDVMDAAEANRGFAEYDKEMNNLRAKLYQSGFTSFSDAGAEQFDRQRKGLVMTMTQPTLPNGQPNPYYNEQFAQKFLTVDKSKDDRMAAALNKLVREKSLVTDQTRQDIQGLITYMDNRNALQQLLLNRDKQGGSADINARSNIDLKLGFHSLVSQLNESNTMFQSLHDRWLSHDMFDHNDPGLNILEGK